VLWREVLMAHDHGLCRKLPKTGKLKLASH
jgi:hypothetical protein